MDSKDLKKILAGVSVAGLLSTGGMTLTSVHAGSGWSAKPSAGSVEKAADTATDGGKDTAATVMEESKDKAVEGVEAEAKKKVDEAAEAVKEEVEEAVEKAAGSSGWSGSK